MSLLDQVTHALSQVNDPELRHPITELGMIEDLSESKGSVTLKVLLTIAACPMQDRLRTDISNAVTSVEGVKGVDLTFGVMNEEQRNFVKKVVRGGRGIASGKGGVGKSSVTANLAVAIAKNGLSVGILDADVYGHSIPRLMGLMGQRPTAIDQMFIPLESYGVKTVSMEMFKPERSDPVAYRGPLLHRVLEQLLSDAYWGDLDVLLIDLPPGTGDLAISLGQLIPTSEIVVVTTPQIAAAEVAERAGRIAHQIHQHVIGVIENMSAFPCPTCSETISLFGEGGGDETSRRLSQLVGIEVPLLGKIPFSPALRTGGDEGAPIVDADPNSPAAVAISDIAEKLMKRSKSLVGVRLGVST
jgi:ATP-binding protein involved in chromosome partitioning